MATPESPAEGPSPCEACRGTGSVLRKRGEDEFESVTCPWCEGTKVFRPDHDAQAAGARLRGDAPPST